MSNINLNKLRDRSYQCACNHGFHDTELSDEHFLMLIITELSEAVEADRKGKQVDRSGFEMLITYTDKGESRNDWFKTCYNRCIKGTIAEELADAVIRLLDLAGLRGISLDVAQEDINKHLYLLFPFYSTLSFPETIYNIISSSISASVDLQDMVSMILCKIFALAEHLKIDLGWHIEQKMKYNELREQKHGKKY